LVLHPTFWNHRQALFRRSPNLLKLTKLYSRFFWWKKDLEFLFQLSRWSSFDEFIAGGTCVN
jgi:hypothetical protein